MKSQINPVQKENGAILVFTALALALMMGMAGLAVDFSHAYTNKTRLQNLADSLALSAAISLLNGESDGAFPDKEAFAENFAKTKTLPAFSASSGNSEISNISASDLTFRFAASLSKDEADWLAAGAIDDAKFVRVDIADLSINTWFMPVLSIIIPGNYDDIDVDSSAVAGAVSTITCESAPVLI